MPTLEELSQVLALIHEAAASPEQWSDALVALTRLTESSKGAVLDLDASGQLTGIAQTGHDPEAQKQYAEYYHAVDPTLPVALGGAPYVGFAVHEHFPATVRSRSEYFTYMARYDNGDIIGMHTRGGRAGRSVLSLQRPLRAPSFGEETKRLFRLIGPHLEIAKRVQTRVADAIAARDVLGASLDRLADAVFIVDAGQRIRHLNASARTLLAADPRLRCRSQRLSFADPRLNSAFQAAVRGAAARSVRSQLLALGASSSLETSEVVVCPVAEAHPLAAPWQEPLVLVMVSLPRSDATAIAARMRVLYQLTPAEARIVALLALGRSVEEIAHASGVRESTLRSQLRTIRGKTGVSRQAELVRIALSGVPLAQR